MYVVELRRSGTCNIKKYSTYEPPLRDWGSARTPSGSCDSVVNPCPRTPVGTWSRVSNHGTARLVELENSQSST